MNKIRIIRNLSFPNNKLCEKCHEKKADSVIYGEIAKDNINYLCKKCAEEIFNSKINTSKKIRELKLNDIEINIDD